jgi:hypothetical protein
MGSPLFGSDAPNPLASRIPSFAADDFENEQDRPLTTQMF